MKRSVSGWPVISSARQRWEEMLEWQQGNSWASLCVKTIERGKGWLRAVKLASLRHRTQTDRFETSRRIMWAPSSKQWAKWWGWTGGLERDLWRHSWGCMPWSNKKLFMIFNKKWHGYFSVHIFSKYIWRKYCMLWFKICFRNNFVTCWWADFRRATVEGSRTVHSLRKYLLRVAMSQALF